MVYLVVAFGFVVHTYGPFASEAEAMAEMEKVWMHQPNAEYLLS